MRHEAITWQEHEAVIARERNPQWRVFYILLWNIGGAQTDVAALRAEDIDWEQYVISYARRKTGTVSHLLFSDEVGTLLKSLPSSGFLFPRLAELHEKNIFMCGSPPV